MRLVRLHRLITTLMYNTAGDKMLLYVDSRGNDCDACSDSISGCYKCFSTWEFFSLTRNFHLLPVQYCLSMHEEGEMHTSVKKCPLQKNYNPLKLTLAHDIL